MGYLEVIDEKYSLVSADIYLGMVNYPKVTLERLGDREVVYEVIQTIYLVALFIWPQNHITHKYIHDQYLNTGTLSPQIALSLYLLWAKPIPAFTFAHT